MGRKVRVDEDAVLDYLKLLVEENNGQLTSTQIAELLGVGSLTAHNLCRELARRFPEEYEYEDVVYAGVLRKKTE